MHDKRGDLMHMVDTLPVILVSGAFLFLIGRMVVDYVRANSA